MLTRMTSLASSAINRLPSRLPWNEKGRAASASCTRVRGPQAIVKLYHECVRNVVIFSCRISDLGGPFWSAEKHAPRRPEIEQRGHRGPGRGGQRRPSCERPE